MRLAAAFNEPRLLTNDDSMVAVTRVKQVDEDEVGRMENMIENLPGHNDADEGAVDRFGMVAAPVVSRRAGPFGV